MAGFGAAHRLHNEGITPVMYDKNGYHGGHTASFRYETGFLFDVGPHISYTKDPRIQQLFAESVDQQYETLQVYLGSAAGAILLGERPENEVFGKLFDWPDALVRLPYDSPEVDEIIHELDLQPERQEMIRRMNVAQALLRHDWVYRWESILESVNLEPLPQLLKRKNRLRSLADTIMPTESAAPCARF
jgi:hypothetical protein